MRTFGTGTKLCAVIGNPISHSLSPALHNAAFEELGLDFAYLAFRVDDVKGALAVMRALDNFRGLSVTIPHKIEIMKHVDEIDEVDRKIGSINTIIHEGDKLIGLGTDGPGALKALTDAGVNLEGKNVLILGAGGASRAISFTLAMKASPARITILDIDKDILDGLSTDLKSGTKTDIDAKLFSDGSIEDAMKDADLIINCTPIGMHPKEDASLVPPALFRDTQVVFDVVYTPLDTKLIKEAKANGLQTISGVNMFINQAVLQFEKFTGKDAPVEVMRNVVMENLTK